jgi:hypothetical protein
MIALRNSKTKSKSDGRIFMEVKNHVFLLSIFLVVLSVISCDQDSQQKQKNLTEPQPQNIQSYNKDGLSLNYPAEWQFIYDDTPDLYANRAVGFRVSEFSNTRVLIEENQSLTAPILADRFEKELQLKSGNLASNYLRESVIIGGFKGEKLSWTDNLSGSANFELTVIAISEVPVAIFAVTHLSEEDIASEAQHIEPFVKSIQFKK